MKILVLGLGAIGQRHVRNLRELLGNELQLSAVRSRGLTQVLSDKMQVEQTKGLHEKYGIHIESDLDSALAARPDAVMICNPTSLHLQSALAAARAGCGLFIEKPLAHSVEGVDELIAVVEKQQLVGLVGYQFRFHPCLLQAKRWLNAGVIGHIVSVRADNAEYLPNWHPYEDYRASYAARRELGGGAILTQIHEMDYLYALFGMPARIVAMGGHLSSLELDVEDTVEVLMEFRAEPVAFPVSLHLDYVQQPPRRSCQIVGDAGQIVLDFRGLGGQLYGRSGELVENVDFRDFSRNQLFLEQTRHFLACLEGREKPLVSIRDAAQSLKIALAAKHSLTNNSIVELAA